MIVENNTSDFTIGVILSLLEDGKLQPVAFDSRKMDKCEINYEIHDKEILAMILVFKVWRRYLEGAYQIITVYSDRNNLEYFTTMKVLN
jgi:hypothetical protein